MADTASAELSAASKLLQQHANPHSHHVTVEDAVDEDLGKPAPATDAGVGAAAAADSSPSWAEPMSAKAAGKQKAQEPVGLDTQSHELFPGLGGSKTKAAAGTAPIWGAKSSANGKSNNTPPYGSAPASGATTPTRAPTVSIPGRNVETLFVEKQHLLPQDQLRRPMSDVLKDLKRKYQANVTMKPSNGGWKFEAAGPQNDALKALKDLMNQIGTKQSVKVPIPSSARALIIGKGGANIKQLQSDSGARIQLPRAADGTAGDEDEDGMVDVLVEGNALSAATARDAILKLAGEGGAAKVNTRLKNIPAEFYPFIAGPKDSLVHQLREENQVRIEVPPLQAWSAQPPTITTPGERPVFVPAQTDKHIELEGQRAAVQAARAAIERQVEELRQQLALEQVSIQRGRHQFIIGERGIPVNQFFEDTGCAIVLPTDEEDDIVTIIGPPDNVHIGLEKAMDLAMNMHCSNIDIARFHRQAPGGAQAHARNVTRYLRERKAIERLEKTYNVHFNTPFTTDGALPWELFSRDGKNAIRAQSEIKGLVDSHPPARVSALPVDPFFHQYMRNSLLPRVREEYDVYLVVPETSDANAPLLLVYEGPSKPEEYEIPRSQPSPAELKEMQLRLAAARSHLEQFVAEQEEVSASSLEVPQKYQDKLKRFIKKQQANLPANQIPVRVSSIGTTVKFRGLRSAVESLVAKCEAFLAQEKEDEKERGFTMEFEFPQKFANHLIGKNGSKISQLRETFDVDIQVKDGKVELKGPKAKADAAKTHILALGRQLQDETSHVLKVDPKFHRELIGREGSQIKKLQDRYKVLILFPRATKPAKDEAAKEDDAAEAGSDAGKPRRQQGPDEVIVRGPKKGADEARDEILSLLQYLKDNSFTATISVQQKQVPSLIGTGGAALEQLRQATGAKIDVPSARDSADGLVEIQIKGTKTQVTAAKKALEEKKAVFDDSVVKTIEVDRKYHKTLIGAGGSNLRDIVLKAGGSDDRRELARTIQFPKQDADGNTIKVEGRSEVVEKILSQIQVFVSQRESEVTEVLDVPQEKHRALIGRGGETRRGLETQFKVAIDVPRQGSGQTGVKIVGQKAGVAEAKAHIESLVKEQEGETIQVPRALHHAVSNNGQLFRRLKSDHHVTVDHAGHAIPAKPIPSAAGVTSGSLPLITDDAKSTADAHSWNVVENASSEEGDIPWVLRGSPENIEKAKKAIDAALEQAKKQNVTGYLILPDPKTHRYVIGQGGSKVNSIRKQSGCKITVPRDQTQGEAIEVLGTKGGVEKAKDLILAAVLEGLNNSRAPREPREPRD